MDEQLAMNLDYLEEKLQALREALKKFGASNYRRREIMLRTKAITDRLKFQLEAVLREAGYG